MVIFEVLDLGISIIIIVLDIRVIEKEMCKFVYGFNLKMVMG